MRRGRAGIGALQAKKAQESKFESRGSELQEESMEHIQKQLDLFKTKLEQFAKDHRDDIKRNPIFRQQFQEMCTKVGVDPLASGKGFWAQLLGVGDFYYELAVQAIDVCISTRTQNGGLIAMEDLLGRVQKRRGKHSQDISAHDITQSISKVACLGNGFQVLRLGSKIMVVSVPCELNRDHSAILELAQKHDGHVSLTQVANELQWPRTRMDTVLNMLLEEGMVWVDNLADSPEYWLPSMFPTFFNVE
jgi:ESCRT-II complex subunit VPS22